MPKKKQPPERTKKEKRLHARTDVLDGKVALNWTTRHSGYVSYCKKAMFEVEACRRAYINEPRTKKSREQLRIRFGVSELTLSRAIRRFGWNEQRYHMLEKNRELGRLMQKAVDDSDIEEIGKLAYIQHSQVIDKFRRKIEANLEKPEMSGKELTDNLRAYKEFMKLTGEDYKKAEVAVFTEAIQNSEATPGDLEIAELEEIERIQGIKTILGPQVKDLPPAYSRDLSKESASRKATDNGRLHTQRDKYEDDLVKRGKVDDEEIKADLEAKKEKRAV